MTNKQIRQAIVQIRNECVRRRTTVDPCVECPCKEVCDVMFPPNEYYLAESPDEWKIPAGWTEPAEQEG